MKSIKIIAVALVFSALAGSCAKDLDLAPIDHYGSGNFWKNTAHVEGEVIGLHKLLRDYAWPMYTLGEIRGGTVKSGTSSIGGVSLASTDIKNNTIRGNAPGISNWAGFYPFILQLNLFIDKVTNECPFLTDAERNRYLAVAHGMRAYAYFWLYRTYGEVPIETTPDVTKGIGDVQTFYKEQSSNNTVLDFIKEEVKKSEELFGTNVQNTKIAWSKDATLMLKAEVYLWSAKVTIGDHQAGGEADFKVAETALNEVISSGRYSLVSNFADLFNADPAKENSSEVIFNFYFDKEEATNNGGTFLSAVNFLTNLQDLEGNALSNDPLQQAGAGGPLREQYKEGFVKSYDATDTRQNGTFFQVLTPTNARNPNAPKAHASFMIKYIGRYIAATGTRHFDTNIILYRYADALLMMAEVQNGLNNSAGVKTYIDQIRTRAYGSNYTDDKAYTAGDYAANELAILKERDKEFVAENKRWFDLIRMHDANKKPLAFSASANYIDMDGSTVSAVLSEDEAYKLVWPIDINTLNADKKLHRTPGYTY